MARWSWLCAPIVLLVGCGDDPPLADGGMSPTDAVPFDSGADAGFDAGSRDLGADGGDLGPDLGPIDPWVPPATVDWSPCTEPGLTGLECANLEVPLDHSAPRARIWLAMAKAPAEDPGRRIGVLLVNPGGPGGRSRQFAATVRDASYNLRRRFDIIGVDWRGVGGSEPVLDCATDAELDELRAVYPLADPALGGAWLERMKDRCLANVGAEALGHVGVVDVAKDMELVRRALGETELNFLGVSYGSRLGAAFATLYPSSMRAFVLDAVMSPSIDPRRIVSDRTISEREGLLDFFDACPGLPGCWTPGATPQNIQTATDAFLMSADMGDLSLDGRTLTAWDARVAVNYLMGPGLYSALGEMIRFANRGDPSLTFLVADFAAGRQTDGTYDNARIANIVIACRDQFGPDAITATGLEASLAGARQSDPRLGGWGFAEYLACPGWPAQSERLAPVARDAPPLLLVGGERDWWSPFDWAVEMQSALANGSFLYRSTGRGHGRWDRTPASNRIRDFFLDPTRAPDETSCLRATIDRPVTSTVTIDVQIRVEADGAPLAELLLEADDTVLDQAQGAMTSAGFLTTVRLEAPSNDQPVAAYVRITSPGVLSAEVHWNAPRRGSSRAVVNLPTQANLESIYAGLGLTFDAGLAHAYVRALDCEGPAGGVTITSSTAGRFVYAGLLDNRCVPDIGITRTDALCGSGYWYGVPPGDYTFGYDAAGAVFQSRPLPLELGIVNQLELDPD